MYWFAIQVASQHEKKVKSYLDKRRADGLAGRVGRVITVEKNGKLLMPGYVFVEADDWPEEYLRPLTTRHKVLGLVKENEVLRVLETPIDTGLRKGDRVEVLAGPLAGRQGMVKSATSRRAKIVFKFFGEEIEVSVDIRSLERLSSTALP